MSHTGRRASRRQFIGECAGLGASLAIPLTWSGESKGQSLPSDITSMTASQLSVAIHARQVSCVEVMQAYLAHIHRYNPVYNAIVSMRDDDDLLAESARADAELARGESRGWMHGMPHAVKDLRDVRGLPTSHGSRLYAGNVAVTDAIHVERIRAAGAVFIGKTNVPELGLGSQSYNDVFGTTVNAYDPTLTSGGSSGGAATGMATQMLPTADGTDMMGSLRNPAAFNNVIGFRPSHGRVPETSEDPFYTQLSVNGPMGRNVEDTIRLLSTIAGFDPRSPLSMRDELPGYEAYRPADLSDLRIAWLGDYDGYLATEPGVLELCSRALGDLSDGGAVVEAAMPAYDLDRLWQTLLTLRHWSLARRQPLLEDPATRELLKPEMIWEIEGSIGLTAADVGVAAVARAQWYRALHGMFERFDVLALPSAQVFPFAADVHWPQSIDGRAMDTYHRWMEVVIAGTLAGVPVVNVPVGFDDRGRPMGMQLIGPFGEDRAVLEIAMAYEASTDFLARRPQLREAI